MIRSRRAEVSRDLPLYARLLGLRHLAPSGFLCFVFLEGGIALGILLALAELVNWWGVLVLPVTIALVIKLNDVVAGALSQAAPVAVAASGPAPARAGARPVLRPAAAHTAEFSMDEASLSRARTVDLRHPGGSRSHGAAAASPLATAVDASPLNGPPATRATWADDVDPRELRARQSAARRYE